MNFKETLRRLTTPASILEEQDAKEQQKIAELNFNQSQLDTAWMDWNKLTCTKTLLAELNICYNEHMKRARELSVQTTGEPSEITTHLIKADALEKVINYVRTGK